jgi:hypothetical protein
MAGHLGPLNWLEKRPLARSADAFLDLTRAELRPEDRSATPVRVYMGGQNPRHSIDPQARNPNYGTDWRRFYFSWH